MTRDDIIRLAREAGWKPLGENQKTEFTFFLDNLERFAALVAAPLEEEIKRLRFCTTEGDAAAAMEYLAYCVEKAVAAEREGCAREVYKVLRTIQVADQVATAIRARGNAGIKWEVEP